MILIDSEESLGREKRCFFAFIELLLSRGTTEIELRQFCQSYPWGTVSTRQRTWKTVTAELFHAIYHRMGRRSHLKPFHLSWCSFTVELSKNVHESVHKLNFVKFFCRSTSTKFPWTFQQFVEVHASSQMNTFPDCLHSVYPISKQLGGGGWNLEAM